MRLLDFIGQQHIKKDLFIHLTSAMFNNSPMEHSIFYGMPGLGKTTIAGLVADELGVNFHQKTGKEFNRDALDEILLNMGYMDILFIDEIHSTSDKIMEILYGPLQIINNLKLDKNVSPFYFEGRHIHPFTLFGATTSAGLITKPLRDRIILNYNFQPYQKEELKSILLTKECPEESAEFIAKRSRGIPRIALNYFLRIRNEAVFEHRINNKLCFEMFKRLKVDENGYMDVDIEILEYLKENGVASESEIYKTLGIDSTDYQNIYEPFLLNERMIKITNRGRKLTKKGLEYVD